MYSCESWTMKKVEHWRINAFELWCWRRLLRVPWTARRSNQSILKEINPEYSLERLMLKLHYFGHRCEEPVQWKRPWCWDRLRARGEVGNRGWDGWMASPTQCMWVCARLWKTVKDREAWHAEVHGVAKSWTGLSNWRTTTNRAILKFQLFFSLTHELFRSGFLSHTCLGKIIYIIGFSVFPFWFEWYNLWYWDLFCGITIMS